MNTVVNMKVLCVACVMATGVGGADMPPPLVTYAYPKFGTPIVSGEYLVFSGPGDWEIIRYRGERTPQRLICVSRADGRKAWEIKTDGEYMAPCFGMDGMVIIRQRGKILSCNPKDGSLRPLCELDLAGIKVTPCALPYALVSGVKEGRNRLMLVDIKTGTKQWEIEKFSRVIALGTDVVLSAQEQSHLVMRPDDGEVLMLTGVSKSDGSILWQHASPAGVSEVQGVAVGPYFVVGTRGRLSCFEQKSGALVKELSWQGNAQYTLCLSAQGVAALQWAEHFNDPVPDRYVVYSVTVPDLGRRVVIKPSWYAAGAYVWNDIIVGGTAYRVDAYDMKSGKKIWSGGQWAWDGIHDGDIFFSEMERDGKHTNVQRITIVTGERKVLYRETLPEGMQWNG